MNIDSKKDIKICKDMTKAYGTSYFLSTYFFPKKLREATWVLYAFVRYPDEIVDNIERDPNLAAVKLNTWISNWHKAYNGDTNVDPVLRANAILWKEYNIPFEYSDTFFAAMKSDTVKNTFDTYAELESYMNGSATVVGYMMCYLIGFQAGALPYARALAEAFQMTNFLRDIKEDLERGRIYVPKEDIEKYGLNQETFSQLKSSEKMIDLINFEIQRTEYLYREAEKGIELLDKGGRRAVRMSLVLYREILLIIKKDPSVVLRGGVRVPMYRKIILIIKNFY
jgi:15-cis-phytoene synthase